MEELASVNWLLEQTKRQFQEFNMSKFDQERADITNSSNKSAKRKRPRESLAVLIYQAMQFHRDKLTVASIANFICDKHAYYRTRKHWTVSRVFKLVHCVDLDYRNYSECVVKRLSILQDQSKSKRKQTRMFLGSNLSLPV
jgi:hypothetical protein